MSHGKNGPMTIKTEINGVSRTMTPITDYVKQHDALDDDIVRTLRRWGRNGHDDKMPENVVVANVFGRWCINVDARLDASDIKTSTRTTHAGTRFIVHVPAVSPDGTRLVDDARALTDDARAVFGRWGIAVTNPRAKRAKRRADNADANADADNA